MMTVPLGGKKYPGMATMIDDTDWAAVTAHSWCPGHTGGPNGLFYPVSRIDGRYTRLHTFLTGWRRVDHEDGDTMNNQRYNLRKATTSQNGANRGKQDRPTTSRFKGVNLHWSGGWRAYITVDGEWTYLGIFTAEITAARAYDLAAIERFGEYARLNFPAESLAAYAAGERTVPPGPPGKITADDAVEIFRRCHAGESDVGLIAADYGLSRRAVYGIRNGRSWREATASHAAQLDHLQLTPPRRLITAEQAAEIYRRSWAGERIPDLAAEYGLKGAAVSAIRTGRNWNSVTHHRETS